jgi:thioredoxin 1
MEQVLQEVQQEFGPQVVIHFVYIDEEENLFHRYKIFFVPTQVFLDATGKEVSRHEGPLLKAKLVQKLRELNFIPD